MDKDQFTAALTENLTTLGFLKDGKPAFVTAADFGKTAALVGDMKKQLGGMLTADTLVEAGMFERGEDGKLKLKAVTPPEPPKPGTDPNSEATKKFEAELAKMQSQLASERKARETAEAQAIEAERNRTIQEALTKAGAVNPQRDYVHLQSAVKRKDDGTLVAVTKDKWGADIEVPVEEFANQWLTSNPELKRATTQQGSGAPAGGGTLPANTVPRSKMQDTNWYMANREKILSGEIKVANQ